MKRLAGLTLGLTLLAIGYAGADVQGSKYYVSPEQLDTTRFMAPPPSAETTRRELEIMLSLQEKRTAEQAERSVADLEQSVFRFADVMGPEFTPEKLPKAAAFFTKVYKTESAFNKQGKEKWDRQRPPVVDARLKPVAKYANSGSYPSGHAAFSYLTAIVLADIVPEKGEAIFGRAVEFGENRVIGGVHYPSDIQAGREMAAMIAVLAYRNPDFQRDLEGAKSEIRGALRLAQ